MSSSAGVAPGGRWSVPAPEKTTAPGVGQEQSFFGPRHSHIKQTPFLFGIGDHIFDRKRQKILLAADDKDDRELQSLGRVKRQQMDVLRPALDGILRLLQGQMTQKFLNLIKSFTHADKPLHVLFCR